MKITTLRLLLILASFPFLGCVPKSQTVVLHPEPVITDATVGHGVRVSVSASDERPDQILGSRESLSGANSATLRTKSQISTNQDVTSVLINQTMLGLKKKGFDPVPLAEQ